VSPDGLPGRVLVVCCLAAAPLALLSFRVPLLYVPELFALACSAVLPLLGLIAGVGAFRLHARGKLSVAWRDIATVGMWMDAGMVVLALATGTIVGFLSSIRAACL
jgi:hypothetical protein